MLKAIVEDPDGFGICRRDARKIGGPNESSLNRDQVRLSCAGVGHLQVIVYRNRTHDQVNMLWSNLTMLGAEENLGSFGGKGKNETEV